MHHCNLDCLIAQVDMPAFAKFVELTCGDIHALHSIAPPCADATAAAAARFGCCWATVLEGYDTLAPAAARMWRLWQGGLSGKAGIEFAVEGCGEPAGERVYDRTRSQIRSVVTSVVQQQRLLTRIVAELYRRLASRRAAGQSLGSGSKPSLRRHKAAKAPAPSGRLAADSGGAAAAGIPTSTRTDSDGKRCVCVCVCVCV